MMPSDFHLKSLFYLCLDLWKLRQRNRAMLKRLFVTSSDDKNGKEQEKENKSVDEKAILTLFFSIFAIALK